MDKKTLVLASIIATACSQQESNPSMTYPEESAIIGLATAIQMSPEGTTDFYYSDYFQSKVDSVRWPAGVTEEKKDDNISVLTADKSTPIESVARFYVGAQPYDIILHKSRKAEVNFTVPKSAFNGEVVTIFGTFNAWNRTADTMHLDGDAYHFTAYLQPGVVEYKFYSNDVEYTDPTHNNIVSNGMGGENSTQTVEAPGDAPAEINVLNGNGNKVEIEALPEDQSLVAIWNNTRIPEAFIHSKDGSVEIEIPADVTVHGASTLRLFSANEAGWSKEVQIPLLNSQVVRDASKLDRSDWRTARMYFMMVDRFANGDTSNDSPLNQPDILPQCDYMGGDVAGILEKLRSGYFDELGVNTIWLSPITQNPLDAWGLWDKGGVYTKFSGYHGYWPISNVNVDKRFTTEELLHQLLDEAHAKGYNVVLDYVANHVHQSHPIIQEHPEWATELYLPDGSMNTERWDDHRLTTWFDTMLPTLDLRKKEVVDPMTDSAMKWVTEFDFDGFRHDATKHIDLLFWRTLTSKVKNQVTEATGKRIYQIGETYGSAELISSYLSTGMLDAQFDFNAYDAIVGVLSDSATPAQRIVDVMNASWDYYGQHNTMGYISGNQDRSRFISIASGDVSLDEDQKLAGYTRDIGKPSEVAYQKLALLQAFNHAIPGIPVIYYGDEYGSPGANDPDNRRMMKFDLDQEEAWLKTQVEAFEHLRSTEMALVYGTVTIEAVGDDLIHIQRKYLNETIDIYLNRSGRTHSVDANPDTILYGSSVSQIEPYSAVISKTTAQ